MSHIPPVSTCDGIAGETGSRDDRAQYLHQFVLHAALDAVDEQQWQGPNMNLGVVDKFNNLQVSRNCDGCAIMCQCCILLNMRLTAMWPLPAGFGLCHCSSDQVPAAA